ncbi:MAG: hypothetical protein AB7G40_04180 [Hyphomonadaceae bacterium]
MAIERYGFSIFIRSTLEWDEYLTAAAERESQPRNDEQVETLARRFERRISEALRRGTGAETVQIATLFAKHGTADIGQIVDLSYSRYEDWERWIYRFHQLPGSMKAWVEREWHNEVGKSVRVNVEIEQGFGRHGLPLSLRRVPAQSSDEAKRENQIAQSASTPPAEKTPNKIADDPPSEGMGAHWRNLYSMLSLAAFTGFVIGCALTYFVTTTTKLDADNDELRDRLNNYEQSRIETATTPTIDPCCQTARCCAPCRRSGR